MTDDSVLSMAVARALTENRGRNDKEGLGDAVAESLQEYYRRYPLTKGIGSMKHSCYGKGFTGWIERQDKKARRRATSNGGAMRIVPAGWLYPTLEETLWVAKLATERTHHSRRAVEAAQVTAASVFLARQGKGKQEICRYAEETYGYWIPEGEEALYRLQEENRSYRRRKRLRLQWEDLIQCDAKQTVERALFAFRHTVCFKDCIRTAVAIGGDSDTIACIAGGIAEAYYGEVPKDWRRAAEEVLYACGCFPEDIRLVMNFKKEAGI